MGDDHAMGPHGAWRGRHAYLRSRLRIAASHVGFGRSTVQAVTYQGDQWLSIHRFRAHLLECGWHERLSQSKARGFLAEERAR